VRSHIDSHHGCHVTNVPEFNCAVAVARTNSVALQSTSRVWSPESICPTQGKQCSPWGWISRGWSNACARKKSVRTGPVKNTVYYMLWISLLLWSAEEMRSDKINGSWKLVTFLLLILATAIRGRPKPDFASCRGRWGERSLPMERCGNSLSGRESNTQPSNWEADTLTTVLLPPHYRATSWRFCALTVLASQSERVLSADDVNKVLPKWRNWMLLTESAWPRRVARHFSLQNQQQSER